MKTAVYLGSLDPPTSGDLDIIRRCAVKFDALIVGVLEREGAGAESMSLSGRAGVLRRELAGLKNVEIAPVRDSLSELINEYGVQVVIRSLRFGGDLERERRFAFAVKMSFPELEFLYMIPDECYA